MAIVNPLLPWQWLLYIQFSELYHCRKKFLVQQPTYTYKKIVKVPLLHQSLGPYAFFVSLYPLKDPNKWRPEQGL